MEFLEHYNKSQNENENEIKPVYFCWQHDEPDTVEISLIPPRGFDGDCNWVGKKKGASGWSKDSGYYDNCERVDDAGWVVFSWNDESGYVFAKGNTKSECLKDFRETYLNSYYENVDEDDKDEVALRNFATTCTEEELEEIMAGYEVDCDSGWAFSLENLDEIRSEN